MDQKSIAISKEIENYIREMEFKRKRLGGIDEEDVLLKMRDLIGLFRKQLDEVEKDDDMDGRLAQLRVALENQKTEAEAAEKELREEAEKAQEEAGAAREEAEAAKAEVEKLRDELKAAKEEVESVSSVNPVAENAGEEIASLKEKIAAQNTTAENYKKEISNLQEKVATQRSATEEQQKEIAALKEKLAAQAAEAESRKAEAESRIKEGDAQRAEADALKKEANALQEENSTLRAENKILSEQLDQALSLNAQYATKVEVMQEKMNEYEKEIQTLRSEVPAGADLSLGDVSVDTKAVLDDAEKMRGLFLAMEETRAEKERLVALTKSIEESKAEILNRACLEADEEARRLAAENAELRRINDELAKALRTNTENLRVMVDDVINRAEHLRESVFALEDAQEKRRIDARDVTASDSFLGSENWG